MKNVLITGITGQDGSYLAEFLLDQNYNVSGMYRRNSTDSNFERIEGLKGKINLVCGDLLDLCSLEKIIKSTRPDEIYNLAAQSQVGHSFDQPHLTLETNWMGVERLLHLIEKYSPSTRLYQASTSEMFGQSEKNPQDERTPFNPVSPYGESKVCAHKSIKREREKGLFACGGILFNHESPRRGLEFVTRKITDGVARIKLGLPQRITGKHYLELGNLDACRDWGHAEDYVRAMWLMIQQDEPDDYVISTGEAHSVREFVETAFKSIGNKIVWEDKGINEIGTCGGETVVKINPEFYRPKDIDFLIGDSTKAKEKLNWQPIIKFEEMVEDMVKSDVCKNQKRIKINS